MQAFSRYVSLLLLPLCSLTAPAQSLLPQADGQTTRLAASITFGHGGMTGICAMRQDGNELKCSLFNEFGISALDFTCRPAKRKVRIVHAVAMLNRWAVKRVLRRDLLHVLDALAAGDTVYANTRRGITYSFSKAFPNESEE